MLSLVDAEVRDIDEASFREGVVRTKFYGELPVPDDLRYMQQTKVGGRENIGPGCRIMCSGVDYGGCGLIDNFITGRTGETNLHRRRQLSWW